MGPHPLHHVARHSTSVKAPSKAAVSSAPLDDTLYAPLDTHWLRVKLHRAPLAAKSVPSRTVQGACHTGPAEGTWPKYGSKPAS